MSLATPDKIRTLQRALYEAPPVLYVTALLLDSTTEDEVIRRAPLSIIMTVESPDASKIGAIRAVRILLPRGVHMNAQEGERVRAGESLMDGPSNAHDILNVLDEKALQASMKPRRSPAAGIFRAGPFAIIGSVLSTMLCAGGAAMTYRDRRWNWVSVGLACATVFGVAAIVESLVLRVRLTDDALFVTDLLGRRRYPVADIACVEEAKVRRIARPSRRVRSRCERACVCVEISQPSPIVRRRPPRPRSARRGFNSSAS